jgi:hypothetical protein
MIYISKYFIFSSCHSIFSWSWVGSLKVRTYIRRMSIKTITKHAGPTASDEAVRIAITNLFKSPYWIFWGLPKQRSLRPSFVWYSRRGAYTLQSENLQCSVARYIVRGISQLPLVRQRVSEHNLYMRRTWNRIREQQWVEGWAYNRSGREAELDFALALLTFEDLEETWTCHIPPFPWC